MSGAQVLTSSIDTSLYINLFLIHELAHILIILCVFAAKYQ
jgi:hypothetical protein